MEHLKSQMYVVQYWTIFIRVTVTGSMQTTLLVIFKGSKSRGRELPECGVCNCCPVAMYSHQGCVKFSMYKAAIKLFSCNKAIVVSYFNLLWQILKQK